MGGMSCSSEFPQRKTRETRVAEKFLGYIFFFLFRWPEATEVGQTAKAEILQGPLSSPKSQAQLLLPHLLFLHFSLPFPTPRTNTTGEEAGSYCLSRCHSCLLAAADGFGLSSRYSVCLCGSGCKSVFWTEERRSGQQSHSGPCASVINT